jgi:hypothetical protein
MAYNYTNFLRGVVRDSSVGGLEPRALGINKSPKQTNISEREDGHPYPFVLGV